tara:strand:+ start:3602 stop:3859 length:258 start_codon:yes stop_codon:yes gene_type:complete
MSLEIQDLKNKILYRSSYRGTKEMDILLKGFVDNVIDTLNKEDLSSLLDLISLDDDNLYKFKTGLKTSILIKENKITKLFKDFNL